MPDSKGILIVIMGVAGSGKTTVGKALSNSLSLPFYDADDFHSTQNIAKMTSGQPLDDADREVWLLTLGRNLKEWKNESGAILACSALKEKYRKVLSIVEDIQWVVLDIDKKTVVDRFSKRKEHFMPEVLITSQFDAWESPDYGIKVRADKPVTEIVDYIASRLHLR